MLIFLVDPHSPLSNSNQLSYSSVPAADEALDDLEHLEETNPSVFKGHRERGGDVIAKMQAALETRFGTSLLSTTDGDRESDRLATIGVTIFSSLPLILHHLSCFQDLFNFIYFRPYGC